MHEWIRRPSTNCLSADLHLMERPEAYRPTSFYDIVSVQLHGSTVATEASETFHYSVCSGHTQRKVDHCLQEARVSPKVMESPRLGVGA